MEFWEKRHSYFSGSYQPRQHQPGVSGYLYVIPKTEAETRTEILACGGRWPDGALSKAGRSVDLVQATNTFDVEYCYFPYTHFTAAICNQKRGLSVRTQCVC